ncbi:hypothetical protein R1flu_008879 [Riccia fluitans]|uniref:Uncharacterized protein n=1 Tax=Riccia fluitans TaxID=41844 RepID=A0ABD1Z0H0_9MARC
MGQEVRPDRSGTRRLHIILHSVPLDLLPEANNVEKRNLEQSEAGSVGFEVEKRILGSNFFLSNFDGCSLVMSLLRLWLYIFRAHEVYFWLQPSVPSLSSQMSRCSYPESRSR